VCVYLNIFFEQTKMRYVINNMVYPAQGVQKANHPIVFTRTRCLPRQHHQNKIKQNRETLITSGHPYKEGDDSTIHGNRS